jgi:hypothetical protein
MDLFKLEALFQQVLAGHKLLPLPMREREEEQKGRLRSQSMASWLIISNYNVTRLGKYIDCFLDAK